MVSCGYQDVVEMLLDFEVNVNVQDNIGRSLVNIAVENDYTGILQKLLTAKADRCPAFLVMIQICNVLKQNVYQNAVV
jgi:hypothetical protein